jgi:uncharacterized protein with HEPN domain
MSVAELPIPIDREKIAEFCHARGIRKLSLFGSVLRDDFDPARSDVDVLAESLRAQELCAQNELPAILTDWQKRLAFERVMEVLGEAVKRLPPDLCQLYPAVPWKLIAGMRDRVSRGYDALDYAILWDTAPDDLPKLIVQIEAYLANQPPPE